MRIPHPRFLLFLALLAGVSGIAGRFVSSTEAFVIGFNIGALAFLGSTLLLWGSDDIEAMRARSARDDGGRVLLPITAALALATTLVALARMIQVRRTPSIEDIALVLITIAIAWLFFNLVYAFHYAHMYYDQDGEADARGIEFPGGVQAPLFADFAYFAFVIGMTCQTADTDITSHRIRRVATGHGLLAFFFNLGVFALTINLLSNVL